jgi:hypothetical protein
VRREVLRLVDDQVLLGDRPAADVRERFDLDDPLVEQVLVLRLRVLGPRTVRAVLAVLNRSSRLSKMGFIHGFSFAPTSPGRNPMSRPSGKIGRLTSIFR